MKRFIIIFFCFLSLGAASPQAPALNYYGVAKYKFGFWFIAEPNRAGDPTPQVQYSLEVLEDSSGWFRPFAPVVRVPGSVISFESVYGDGQRVFNRLGFARIIAEWLSPRHKDNRPRQGAWEINRPIPF